MVTLERFAVVRPFVAEYLAKTKQSRCVANESIPVVVSDLVAKVTEQRAIALFHGKTNFFALHRVRLGHVERDETVLVPGQHAGGTDVRLDVEREPSLRVVLLRVERQVQLVERVDEAALPPFRLPPKPANFRVRQGGQDM